MMLLMLTLVVIMLCNLQGVLQLQVLAPEMAIGFP
jgi:hypothetical protein